MFQRILFPTDGSSEAEEALEDAIAFAKKYEADLHVLYVVDTYEKSWQESVVEEVIDIAKEEGNQALDRVVKQVEREGVTVRKTLTRNNRPEDAILDYAEKQEIDLIVMGTHGRSGFKRLFLGSTTERVMRRTDLPVLAVPAKDPDAEA